MSSSPSWDKCFLSTLYFNAKNVYNGHKNGVLLLAENNCMRERLYHHWPLWIALLALWMLTGVIQFRATLATGGRLIYALDDAYIHMSMAKNLALHGVYGVTPYEFSSSSSSPVWTLLVGLVYLLFGVHDCVPFILDLIASSLALVAASLLLQDRLKSQIAELATLLAIAFLTPLPVLTSSGMEHPLQVLFVILFLALSARSIVEDPTQWKGKNYTSLLVVCGFLVMTRFESYALVLIICVLAAIRRRWKIAIGLGLASLLPLFLYQAISVAHGWQWLPNSILIRSSFQDSEMENTLQSVIVVPWSTVHTPKFWLTGWNALQRGPQNAVFLVTSLIVLVLSLLRTKRFWQFEHVVLVVFIGTTIAQLQFGKIGFFFRYDAYLVAMGIFALAVSSADVLRTLRHWMSESRWKTVVGSIVLLLALQLSRPLLVRAFLAYPRVPKACKNIYQQQYQMGLFLQRYYQGKTVAANDIGAITYLADIHLVDLIGLASRDILHLRQTDHFNADEVLKLCDQRRVSIAVAYESWLEYGGMRGFRRAWREVGWWKINDNVVCASNVVTFFAVQPAETQNLTEHLEDFTRSLPPDVEYRVKPIDSTTTHLAHL